MNAIFVVADSLRRDHLGCYGNEWIRTPHLDAFAGDSAVFEDAYQSSHPTLPNRQDHFIGRYGFPWYGWGPLPREPKVLSEYLDDAGFETSLIGDTYHMFKEGNWFQRGFHSWQWIRGQEGDNLVSDPTIPIVYPAAMHKLRLPYPDRYPQMVRNRHHRRVESDWLTPQLYTTAMDWIDQNHSAEPFMLWIDGFDPHEPWDPPEHYIDMYDAAYDLPDDCDYPDGRPSTFLSERELKRTRARYAAEVTMVDRWFGRLMDRLSDLNVLDDTLIVFTTDHGHYLNYPGDGGLIGKPLSYKGESYPMYQSLVNIPLVVRPPGGCEGRRQRGIVQPPDTLATMLEHFGVEVPEDTHGKSWLPAAMGGEWEGRPFAVSAQRRNVATVNDGRWSYSCWQGKRRAALYDLKTDPLQQTDLIETESAAAAASHQRLVSFLDEIGAADEAALYTAEGPTE
ncbi:MAG TPA: sulfatase [Armatimonadota bacterium]|nr:sulfatase [Armatimonadota bacterium]